MKFVQTVTVVVLTFLVTSVVYAESEPYPKPVFSMLPMYPEAARQARITGTVKLWFSLNSGGETTQVEVITGNPILRDAAMAIVRSWKFGPNTLPPDQHLETEFVYRLDVQTHEGIPKLIVTMKNFRHIEIESELYVKPVE